MSTPPATPSTTLQEAILDRLSPEVRLLVAGLETRTWRARTNARDLMAQADALAGRVLAQARVHKGNFGHRLALAAEILAPHITEPPGAGQATDPAEDGEFLLAELLVLAAELIDASTDLPEREAVPILYRSSRAIAAMAALMDEEGSMDGEQPYG